MEGVNGVDFDGLTRRVTISRIEGQTRTESVDVVVIEFPLTIYLNNREIATLLCTPERLDCLAVGFLESEGLLTGRDEIAKLVVDGAKGRVWIESPSARKDDIDVVGKRLVPSGCGHDALFYNVLDAAGRPTVTSDLTIRADQISELMREFQLRSRLYRATGGVHSAALCSGGQIVIFCEDIARHNAVDKVFGYCLLNGVATADRVLLTTGRISSEILLKAAKRGVPVVVSKAAPTSLSLRLAEEVGVTVV
ncbi:MAG: formate dehydrogenase accessory sulfurtransferase FdhD, partial [Dehalococcoidia bacterium]|nr:formate dehydrogenase accessory sulfurtransferase FdhD [Dehalococcoidia bacterium]